jgi:hypothetical protein
VSDVTQFQRNFLRVVRSSSAATARMQQQQRQQPQHEGKEEDALEPVRIMLAGMNLRKAELRRELRRNEAKLGVVKNHVYINVQALSKGPPAAGSTLL